MNSNKVKIIIDTNVFVNNFIFPKTNVLKVFEILSNLFLDSKIELVFSQETCGELFYVIKDKVNHYVKKKNRGKIIINIALLFLNSCTVNTSRTIAPKCKDPNDNMFLKCAVKSKAKYLISDDLKSKMGEISLPDTIVLTAEEFIDEYNKANQSEQEIASEEEYNDEE